MSDQENYGVQIERLKAENSRLKEEMRLLKAKYESCLFNFG